MPDSVRILLLADSHIGFDLPTRPRVDRRRRGHDFLANYAAALEPAFQGEVDIVVHGGDVFDRPSVPPTVAYQALDPLRRLAERGVPVFIVPGNHERSQIPHSRFVLHESVHVFDRPRTFVADVRGVRIAFSGFPYERRSVRERFSTLLEECEWRRHRVDVQVLCMHHCVEGATVGPSDFVFTTAMDVVRLRDIPIDCAAVLSGHIHRRQAITADLHGRPLATPVLYPGSIERTSFAEMGESKGFMVVHVGNDDGRARWDFRDLPARPMVRRELEAGGMTPNVMESSVREIVGTLPVDAVVSIRIVGDMTDEHWRTLSAARLRTFVPPTMNLDITPADRFPPRVTGHVKHGDEQPEMALGA